MEISGQHFHPPLIDRIHQAIQAEPDISRCKLSKRICRWLDWRSPNGQLQDMSCRKALVRLSREGILQLPDPQRTYHFQKAVPNTYEPTISKVECSLSELGPICVEPITSRYTKESKKWFALMDRYHYLSGGPLCGAQIRYLVKSDRYGYLGGLAFSSGSWALKARDSYIGWSEAARRKNLKYVVGNDRFLILPIVKVANLASHVLSLALSRLTEDWQQRYNYRPVMVETFVDPERFKGTCYKAANWHYVGDSAGRRDGIAKNIYVYGLCSDWREVLKTEPAIKLGDRPVVHSPSNWAQAEFGSARLYDNRLKNRLYDVAQSFYGRPLAGIAEACGSKAGTMGAYRFFQNKKVTMDVILTAHTEAAIKRIKTHRVVLAPQDTTTLNYSTHPMTEGLGPIRNANDHFVGLILHDTLAFTEDGTPLGVLDAQCWARDPNDRQKCHRRKELPIEQKESMKWLHSFRKVAQVQKLCPDTMIVSTGDRESDIYELLQEAVKDPDGPKLLIRMNKSRQRKVEQQLLWDLMDQKDVAGSLKIHLPRNSSRKSRDTLVDVRFSEVALSPPTRCKLDPPIRAWVVYVKEQKGQAPVKAPIEWMLLSTVPVTSFEDAQKRIEWYSGRWGIEVYHRTLKSGCRIKDRQLGSADRLETSLAVDMVVAWRIYHLTMLGRETPEMPCTVFFKDIEWKALCCYVNKSSVAPERPPTLGVAMRMVGSIGGHLGRKSDGPPGTQALWRGIQRLDTAVEMFAIMTNQQRGHPLKSGP